MNIDGSAFHDNPIHSIEFIDEDYNTDLILDIDYITEWIECDGKYQFKISPAFLTFTEVSDLKINILKTDLTQNGYLETILDMKTEKLDNGSTKHTIVLMSNNYIEFCAKAKVLDVSTTELIKDVQYLTKAERKRA